VGMLDGRIGYADHVRLLEGVETEHRLDGLAGDDDHGNRIHGRGHDTGNGISSSRTGSDQDHAGLAGSPSQAVGHMSGALFMAGEDEFDGRIHQGIEYGNGGATGMPENILDAMLMDAMD